MQRSDDRDRQDDLDATAESLRDDAKRITEIEEHKQDLDVGDPRVDALSNEAEHLAGQIQHKSRIQRQISDGDSADGPDPEERAN
jgi:hypothetical protein